MEDNNQRVIFLVSEEATPAEIILDILKKNGINDPTDDFEDESKTPRLVIVNEATKDFFEKKITEEKMSELFQNELKISKETAMGIINDIKVRLIPYAKKKINEPAAEKKLEVGKEKNMDIFPKIKPLASTIKSTKENLPPPIKESKGKSTLPKKIKKPIISEEVKESIPQQRQPKGPDNYREPIE